MGVLRQFSDGLVNMVSGRGTDRDKSAFNQYFLCPLTPQQIDATYRASWLARKIVDTPPYDMTREWRDWQANAPQIEALEKEEKRLGLADKIRRALVLGGLGGGAIYIGAGEGDASLPINTNALGRGSLRYIHVLSRYQLTLGAMVTDPASPFFGEPSYFEIASQDARAKIHPSRMIPFRGLQVPDLGVARQDDWYWGDSVLQSVDSAVKNADAAQGGFAALIDEAKLDIIKIANLTSNFASTEYEGLLTKRLSAAQTMKSTQNALILDGGNGQPGSGEDWEQRQLTWAGMPDIIKTYLEIVAGAADIPATRLLGKSPDGMNATGAGDEKNYYQNIRAHQNSDLRPALERIDEVLIRSALGTRDASIYFEFAPLFMSDDKELAEIENKNADTIGKLVNSGTVPVDALSTAVQNRMVESGQWPGLEAALEASTMAPADPNAEDPSALQAANENNVVKLRQRGAITGDQAIALLADAAPRALYVRRDVVNVAEIKAWAKKQKIPDLLDDLHVTIIYSRTPMDWIKAGNASEWGATKDGSLTIGPGGPRVVEPLGEMTAVLLFASTELGWRHLSIVEAGASHDYEGYTPHVSLTKTEIDLQGIEPYRGRIVLGPEIFQEIEA